MFIDSEVLAAPGELALCQDSVAAWDKQHAEQVVSVEERDRIISNIRRGFAFNGRKLEVI